MKYNVAVMDYPTEHGILTTDHPASSYKQPVLVIEGVAYGQGDKINGHMPLHGAERMAPATERKIHA
jgi:hypothetical protein